MLSTRNGVGIISVLIKMNLTFGAQLDVLLYIVPFVVPGVNCTNEWKRHRPDPFRWPQHVPKAAHT